MCKEELARTMRHISADTGCTALAGTRRRLKEITMRKLSIADRIEEASIVSLAPTGSQSRCPSVMST